jgi:hypothetical protein
MNVEPGSVEHVADLVAPAGDPASSDTGYDIAHG